MRARQSQHSTCMRERLLCTSMSYTRTVRRLLPFLPSQKLWKIARTITSQLRSTVSSSIDTTALRGLTILPLALKDIWQSQLAQSQLAKTYWHRQATTRRLTRQPNPSDYRKAESLRGADLRRFFDSNTPRGVFGSISHVVVSPNGCMLWLVALVPGTGGISDRRGARR